MSDSDRDEEEDYRFQWCDNLGDFTLRPSNRNFDEFFRDNPLPDSDVDNFDHYHDDSVVDDSNQDYSEDDSDQDERRQPNYYYLNFIKVTQFIAQHEVPNSINQSHDRPSPLPGNSNPWNSPQAAAEVLPTNTIATTDSTNTRGESYESGLQTILRRVINYYPSLVTASPVTVLLIGIRERWIGATMKQVVVEDQHSNPNNESMGIWKDCYCGNNNNNNNNNTTIGGGTMDANEEC